MDSRRSFPAVSPVIGAMLLVGMTVVLSALVYLLVLSAPPPVIDPSRFQFIHITDIRHPGDPVATPCDDSCILLIHEGNAPLENDRLSAIILGNDEMVRANITTLNGKKYPATKHFGVKNLGGAGSRGSTWDPGEEIYIDLKEDLVKEGDLVTVRIVDKDSNLVISEDTARA
ncbi:MAG TPA: type IV pilin N-terminal domain-containing protein [Methanomicrobiales archaeon]|nr:type IV pilin N-terminal domain-containing protein [Methanomicrobiales archaeon]